VWGAACEAVHPQVAGYNWNPFDRTGFENSMNALRYVQERYFGEYFNMPAQCPLSVQVLFKGHGRVINRAGEVAMESRPQLKNIGGVTSECDKVEQLAGLIDHCFYKHGWSREECAQAVEWYEQRRFGQIVQNFNHFQVN
jgi:hypothetical protein